MQPLHRPRKNTKVDFWLMVFRHPSEKYESVGLTICNIWEKNMFQTTNQIWFRSFRLLGDETLTDFAIHSLCIWANWNNEIAESRDCKIEFSD
jgi:hypothetical protein